MESTSDCESGLTFSSSSSSSTSFSSRQPQRDIFSKVLATELEQGEKSYNSIRQKFVLSIGEKSEVVAVHRKNWSEDLMGQARVMAFKFYAKALEKKHGGASNVKFGWYGGDKHRIQQILAHGFGYEDLQMNNCGVISLFPVDSPSLSVENSGVDEDGLRHVLLCRVLLGQAELIQTESGQMYPSSNKFNSGVDSHDNPKKYVIWSSNMNTHILPEYVVTFKIRPPHSFSSGVLLSKTKNAMRMPKSPWISFPALTSVLRKFLAPDAISLINKYHRDYRARKISRRELIHIVRQIAGEKLLMAVIKSITGSKDFRKFNLLHLLRHN